MVRNGARGSPRTKSCRHFGRFHTIFAADVLCAGAAFFDRGGIPRITVAFTGADRKVTWGEKVGGEIGRTGKSGEARSGMQGHRICACGVGPSAREGADCARGIYAGDGAGAIRNQRWTARSGGAENFRGKFLDPREIAETADAAGFTRLLLGWRAPKGRVHARGVRGGPRAIVGVLPKSWLSGGAGWGGEG